LKWYRYSGNKDMGMQTTSSHILFIRSLVLVLIVLILVLHLSLLSEQQHHQQGCALK
jgi:hypothetical protein